MLDRLLEFCVVSLLSKYIYTFAVKMVVTLLGHTDSPYRIVNSVIIFEKVLELRLHSLRLTPVYTACKAVTDINIAKTQYTSAATATT